MLLGPPLVEDPRAREVHDRVGLRDLGRPGAGRVGSPHDLRGELRPPGAPAEDGHLVAALRELAHEPLAEKPRPAGDEDLHRPEDTVPVTVEVTHVLCEFAGMSRKDGSGVPTVSP